MANLSIAGAEGALIYLPVIGAGALGATAAALGGFLTYKGLNWLAQKLFGTKEEAIEFAKLHLAAAEAGKPNFEFQGKSYPVKIKNKEDASDLMMRVYELETQLKESLTEEDDINDPVVSAITRRIIRQHPELLKHGPDKVLAAIADVADFVGDVEEIGSSDVSGWVKQVERSLGSMDEGMGEEELDEQRFPDNSNSTAKRDMVVTNLHDLIKDPRQAHEPARHGPDNSRVKMATKVMPSLTKEPVKKLAGDEVEEGSFGDMAKKVGGAVKTVGSKVLNKLGHDDDTELLKKLQKDAGIPAHAQHGKPNMGHSKDEEMLDELSPATIQSAAAKRDAQKPEDMSPATQRKDIMTHMTNRINMNNRPDPVEEGASQLSIQQLATISDEALDNAYKYGRSSPGNTFGWQANLKSAQYAKQMIDKGVTDIEAISDAIHKGWNVTAQAFVQNPEQFDDTAKLQTAGKLEAKLQQRAELMKKNYSQLPEEEKEKDRVVARALLQALKGQQGQQGVAESEFAGDYATGEAGQWRNKGPKANKPATIGDLVGEGQEDLDAIRRLLKK